MIIEWVDQTRRPELSGAHYQWTGRWMELARLAGIQVREVTDRFYSGEPFDVRILMHALTEGGPLSGDRPEWSADDGKTIHLGYHGFVGTPAPRSFWWALSYHHWAYYKSRGITDGGVCAPPYWGNPECLRGPATPRRNIALFASSWDRGLPELVRAWPRIRRSVADAELRILYGPPPGWQAPTGPGIHVLGRVPYAEVLREMRAAKLVLCPDLEGTEMYCFAAREGLASGAAAITGNPSGVVRELGGYLAHDWAAGIAWAMAHLTSVEPHSTALRNETEAVEGLGNLLRNFRAWQKSGCP